MLEVCVGNVQLTRYNGEFENDDGETIKYTKYSLIIDGAEVEVKFDKDVKSLIAKFVPFQEVKEEK